MKFSIEYQNIDGNLTKKIDQQILIRSKVLIKNNNYPNKLTQLFVACDW